MSRRNISQSIYPVCRTVEQQFVGQQDPIICGWWGEKNAFRHSITIEFLLDKAMTSGRTGIRIFNMSGLSCGHQDFSITSYLREQGVTFSYYALEHPDSPYLGDPNFRNRIGREGIHLLLDDLNSLTKDRVLDVVGRPDVILFTEIAEHLEHATFLRALHLINQVLTDSGFLFLSTPNSDRLAYRLKRLLGEDIDHWGEGHANLEKGLFGHIVYYSLPRLQRLCADAGLHMMEGHTFYFPYPDPKLGPLRRSAAKVGIAFLNGVIRLGEKSWRVPRLMQPLKTLGEQIYLVARKGERKTIPFAL